MYIILINNTYLTSFDTIEEAEEYVEECEYDDLVNYYKIVEVWYK